MHLQTKQIAQPQKRSGLTMFEVVLALAIFLGAMAAITQILRNGSIAAIKSQQQSEAAMRAERRLNEILSGVLPMQMVQGATFEDDPNWRWSVTVLETGTPYLMELQVEVDHVDSRGNITTTFGLNRLYRDPQVFEDALLLTEEEL